MSPTLLPQRSVSSAVPRVDSTLRLSLGPVLDRRAVVDGAWWPYSCDATAELPTLIAAVDQRLGRTTLRIGVHRDTWQHLPRRLPARGRQVRIGWFRHADPRVITLVFAVGEPVVLLIIPPDAAAGVALATFKLTLQDTAGMSLDESGLPLDPGFRAATTTGPARWENEGGSVLAQQTAPA
ncbi:DUF5994 family protein [Nonomuraea sp. NPDC050310]|uniref:DUF5994 family protein n=1 Tax=Nonomuraea sp. NPDC050310 TaxID=3154935 RepID=UPI0033DE7BF8